MRKFIKKTDVKKELDSDECELFLNAFHQGEIPKNINTTKRALEDRELFLDAVENLPVHQKVSVKRTVAKSTKKKSMVDATIDLHGMYAEQAIMALQQFMQRELKKGSKKLLVVHGKGSGVLRAAVWSYIEYHPEVDDFQVAIGKMGGEGAILIRINQSFRK